ncbi:ABC transporter permease [Actinomadura vinacea]|uniref:ABC transporter permease n=1 Tax=Actinomadura vinacea TaxID=115336 RepID=A0ABN3ISQ9_9ACTN
MREERRLVPDVVAAEWLKLRTVRSTHIVFGTALVIMLLGVLLAWQATVIWDGLTPERRARFVLSEPAGVVCWAGGLCLGVWGVLAVTSEYRTGMIRTTLTAVPGRSAVLAAKAGVVGTAALAAGLVMTLVTFFATRLFIGDRPIPDYRTAVVSELPELLARASMLPVYALLGLGLAVLLRSTAGAIVGLTMPWYLLPIFTGFLPETWGKRISAFLPDSLPEQIAGGDNATSIFGTFLPPAVAVAVAVAYAALPLWAGAFVLNRRDA